MGPRGKGFPGALNHFKHILQPFMRARGITLHGSSRSTFEDWAAECCPEVPRDVVRACHDHAIGSKVDQAYMRSDLLEQRRDLMQRWSDYLTGTI
jgi:hypothetical protein